MGLFDFIQRKHSLLESGVLAGSSDRHCHILFSVDDGVATLEEALDILEYEEVIGVKEVWCTPHIMEDVPNATRHLQEIFTQLSDAYQGPVRLHLAAEYMLDSLFEERLRTKDLLIMEEDMLLVETSAWNPPPDLNGMIRRVQQAGYRPLLAHPERYRYMDEHAYEILHDMGVLFQLNAGSLAGYYGRTAMQKAGKILSSGWYGYIGSDCHRLTVMREQYEKAALTKSAISHMELVLL